ncbi:NADH-quinone oxidoreductase subunit J [Pleionea sediminis]|uniref:NADH-quinone oxidoreductase subunit J n=1 Tax=Pleionea sediminis TaxID=2569479 RepID=UPI001FEAF74B|nr:NADH-quinone oxidoreductase subunit J [Pleionea sediminis]
MEINFEQIVFYGFSALLILSALMVILVKNSVKAVLFLVLSFFSTAGLWMLLQAEFLAIALVLVYVGAVMVLFLFVVMMLDVRVAAARHRFTRLLPLAIFIAAGFLYLLHWIIGEHHFGSDVMPPPSNVEEGYSNVRELGKMLYTDYFLPFELAAVILLVAMIAAISLTFRGKRSRKSQNIDKQVRVTKAERLKIISYDTPQEKDKSKEASS